MLFLLLPHRAETDLLAHDESPQHAFLHLQSLLDRDISNSFINFGSQIDNALMRLRLIQQELDAADNDFHNEPENESPDRTPNTRQFAYLHNNTYTIPHPQTDVTTHEELCCRLPAHLVAQQRNSLTPSQSRVFTTVEQHFATKDSSVLHLYISGSGGCGKSYLINLIIAYLQHSHYIVLGTSPVLVAAPTGTAARNVRGSTLHSLFRIPVSYYHVYEPLLPRNLATLQDKFSGVHTLIIDEISMVSSFMFTYISRRLQEISGSSDPFGGFNVIVVGDLHQLKPIKGKPIYTNHILWRIFDYMQLSENVRQSQDPAYGRLLTRARLGHLLDPDMALLKTRLYDPETADPDHVLHVYPLRSDVQKYNDRRQAALSTDTSTTSSIDYFGSRDPSPGLDVPDDLLPHDDAVAGNLPRHLNLSIHSRVMLIRNIMTSTGLVNGAIGTVSHIECTTSCVTSIWVLFDDPTVGQLPGTDMHTHSPIRVKHTYTFKSRSIVREAFPLIQAWACTIHKVQGMTFDHIAVDMGVSIFEPGQGYVAISRVKTLNGLYIARLSPNSISSRLEVLEEYGRLRNSA